MDVEATAVLTSPPETKKVDTTTTTVVTESPEHWPALSDSIRSSKSNLPDSLKALSIGGSAAADTFPQGNKGDIEKENEDNMPKPNILHQPQSPTTNIGPNRQNYTNRNSSRNNNKVFNNKLVDVGMSQVQSAPGSPSAVLSHSGSGSSIGESSSSMDNSSRKNNGAHKNDQQQFRRSQSGPLFNNRGNAREQDNRSTHDRRKKDWGSGSRSFGGRENHSQQHHTAGYRPTSTRGPTPAPPYVPYQVQPVAFQPYSPQMVYQGVHAPQLFFMPGPHPDFQRPTLTMIPQMPFPVPDLELSSRILKQIEYYFSDDNLVKDWFLRKQMDGEGWVPISLVARFRMVSQLTEDIQLIMEALQVSNAVEVQGDKIRRKTDWARWIPRPE